MDLNDKKKPCILGIDSGDFKLKTQGTQEEIERYDSKLCGSWLGCNAQLFIKTSLAVPVQVFGRCN